MAIHGSVVQRVANEEIRELCAALGISAADYRVTVMQCEQQPRMWLVYWNVIEPNKDGRVLSRSTAVDISENEDVLRERLRQIFAKEPEDLGIQELQTVRIP